jgi:hypothetical protein
VAPALWKLPEALKSAQKLPKLYLQVTPIHLRLQPQEVAIRTLGVSLVAVAALAASMTLVRQRNEQRSPESPPVPDDAAPAALDLNLDAIRSAGL